MKKILYVACLSVLGLTFVCSCDKVGKEFPDEVHTCNVTLSLNTLPFNGDGADTRAAMVGSTDENKVNDIWIFQFDATTGNHVSMVTPTYIDNSPDTDDIQISLAEGNSIICVVANTGDRHWIYQDTSTGVVKEEFLNYSTLIQQSLTAGSASAFLSSVFGATDGSDRGIPMFGSALKQVSYDSYIQVPLVRMFARVHVSIDTSYLPEGMGITDLSFNNIPVYCRLGSLGTEDASVAGDYPADITWTSQSQGSLTEAILYMPENLQGTVAEMSEKSSAGESLFPAKAFYLSITAEQNSSSKTYKIYPGLNMKNDFNIRRNTSYTVNVTISNPIE